jgi:hypothetical protein
MGIKRKKCENNGILNFPTAWFFARERIIIERWQKFPTTAAFAALHDTKRKKKLLSLFHALISEKVLPTSSSACFLSALKAVLDRRGRLVSSEEIINNQIYQKYNKCQQAVAKNNPALRRHLHHWQREPSPWAVKKEWRLWEALASVAEVSPAVRREEVVLAIAN